MIIIDLKEWHCNFTEFCNWVANNHAEVTAHTYSESSYYFKKDSDVLAFKLRFSPRDYSTRDFFDNGDPESNYF